MENLITNNELRATLGNNLHSEVLSKFDLKTMLEKTSELYVS